MGISCTTTRHTDTRGKYNRYIQLESFWLSILSLPKYRLRRGGQNESWWENDQAFPPVSPLVETSVTYARCTVWQCCPHSPTGDLEDISGVNVRNYDCHSMFLWLRPHQSVLWPMRCNQYQNYSYHKYSLIGCILQCNRGHTLYKMK